MMFLENTHEVLLAENYAYSHPSGRPAGTSCVGLQRHRQSRRNRRDGRCQIFTM